MHELPVTQNILDIALRHAQPAGNVRITHIYLVIGQLSSIVDESVQFYWNILTENTIAESSILHFKRLPAIMKCNDCEEEYELGEERFLCPTCGSSSVQIISGKEFYIEAIDVENLEQSMEKES